MASRGKHQPLPEPRLVLDTPAASTPALTLTELLEQASRSQAVAFGERPLIGECIDTHNPHLPGRLLVQARGEDGKLAAAWLPMLAELRVGAGQRVLLSKPYNWPEPIVVGVIAGLEAPTDDGEQQASEPAAAAAEPSLRLEPGQALVVHAPGGKPLLRVSATADDEARVELLPETVEFEVPGKLRLSGESVELRARSGGIDLRTDGDATVRARVIRLN